ncbi:uncharacterized protein GIQ15_03219 [Arthroderma uncinatum]|uniref:uncharacterized protein n=1 Tax=Arthroderma uncinatum TaxID=74035 RepID=UPI00144AF115|nr:uncharacterized protein GIQ15_03219 [Arthroderma uncinatum]KAF3483895.1 hypothetical protein GIQ15_03219 [Arthroderma uncinatum]
MASSKEKAPPVEEKTTAEPPPAYTPAPNGDIPPVSPVLQRPLNFDFKAAAEARLTTTVLVDECIAHLKLLRSLADLRDLISKSDGLFGIHDIQADVFENEEESRKALALIREKRWEIYVTRAAHRFEIWVRSCTPTGGPGSNSSCVMLYDVEENPEYKNFPKWEFRTLWSTALMPPLDVVMVWHAYMLNPRDVLEDCLRLGKMSFWTSGLPLDVINECIDNTTFEYTPDLQKDTSGTMFKARDILGQAIQNGGRTRPNERIAVRRMMSRYWENSSPFALDLVGAVVRQGVFIDKMDKIDWLHSPALESTMARLIDKYVIFFRIIAQNKGKLVVPTLDVDLAWHTHQLKPQRYYAYSMQLTQTFVNHDDKVVETQLTDGFEWTSKQYQKITGGGIYSECTCWYCEAVREPHVHALFSTSAPTARKNAAQLRIRDDISPDPDKNPHISAHNSVREPETPASRAKANLKFLELRNRHYKMLKRAGKRGDNNNKNQEGIPMYYWGVPLVAGPEVVLQVPVTGMYLLVYVQRREEAERGVLVVEDAEVEEAAAVVVAEAEAEGDVVEEGVDIGCWRGI